MNCPWWSYETPSATFPISSTARFGCIDPIGDIVGWAKRQPVTDRECQSLQQATEVAKEWSNEDYNQKKSNC